MVLITMIPIRFVFRSRWAALAWAGGICLTAINVAGDRRAQPVDAASASDSPTAIANALAAEDPE